MSSEQREEKGAKKRASLFRSSSPPTPKCLTEKFPIVFIVVFSTHPNQTRSISSVFPIKTLLHLVKPTPEIPFSSSSFSMSDTKANAPSFVCPPSPPFFLGTASSSGGSGTDSLPGHTWAQNISFRTKILLRWIFFSWSCSTHCPFMPKVLRTN